MNILYKHNAEAYEKVKKSIEENDRTCIIHATGIGKSFIALQLMYDFLKDTPDKKVKFFFPLNGIGSQLHEHIKGLKNIDKSVFNKVDTFTKSHQTLEKENMNLHREVKALTTRNQNLTKENNNFKDYLKAILEAIKHFFREFYKLVMKRQKNVLRAK